MSSIRAFLLREEIAEITRRLAQTRDLGGYIITARDFFPFDPLGSTNAYLDEEIPGYMLVPRSDAKNTSVSTDDVSPRYQGWIQIMPGLVKDRKGEPVLELTTIVAEDHKDLPFRSAYWVSNLKKKLIAEKYLKFGVKANSFEGEHYDHVYKDVGYSKAALGLFNEGLLLMQYKTNANYYTPVEKEW